MRTITLLAALAAFAFAGAASAADAPAGTVKPVASEALPNVPGKRLQAILLTYPPGGVSSAHVHGGSILAYVISGSVRSALDNGEVRVFKAGESFFERPGQTHRVSENASASEPATLLVVMVGDEGAVFTTPLAR